MKTYRLDPTGRRAALLLGIGALAVWIFAVWKLPAVLGLSYANLVGDVRDMLSNGLTVSQIVPGLLLAVIVIAAPLLLWNIAEEWSTTYTVRDDGLLYDTVQGISVLYPWGAIKGLRQVDPEADEPVHELVVDDAGIGQIRSNMLRWLHRQAFGRTRIPLYAHIAERDELMNEIIVRAGLQAAAAGNDDRGASSQGAALGS